MEQSMPYCRNRLRYSCAANWADSGGRRNTMAEGGCDEEWAAAFGSGIAACAAAVTWPTGGGSAREPTAVLGGHCDGCVERGGGERRRRVASGRLPLVPGVGRHATEDTCAIVEAFIGAVPVVCRARGDRVAAGAGLRGPGDVPATGPGRIDDLA